MRVFLLALLLASAAFGQGQSFPPPSGTSGPGGAPSGAAGGGLAGNYPNPTIAPGQLANDQTLFTVGSGGVTANTLVQISGGLAVAATGGYGGIAQKTVASGGSVQVTRTSGVQQPCVFDNTAVVNDVVIPSTTTPIDCHDSGLTSSQSIAITTQVVGVVLTAGSGTQTVLMHSIGNGYGLLLPTVVSQLGYTPQNAAAANALNDALGAAAAVPIASGASLPSTCTVGLTFNLTSATAGQNLYGCTASNVWTAQGGNGAATIANGQFSIAPGVNTATVLDSHVTATADISVQQDDGLGSQLAVTCYTAAQTAPIVASRVPGVSFTLNLGSAPVANAGCYSYAIASAGGSSSGGGTTAYAPTGTQSMYLLGEGSGTSANDSSGNGNTCTLATSTNAPTWIVGGGLNFVGTPTSASQYMTCPAAAFNGAQTLEIWLTNQTPNTNGGTSVISTDAASHTLLQVVTSSTGWGSPVELFTTSNGTFLAMEQRAVGPTGLTYTLGSTPTAYVNGAPAWGYKQRGSGLTSLAATTSITVGMYVGTGPGFTGQIYAIITRPGIATAAQIALDNTYILAKTLTPQGLAEQDFTNYTAPLRVSDGDSIVLNDGTSDTFNSSITYDSSLLLPSTFDTYVVAISGETMATMASGYAARVHPLMLNHLNPIRLATIAGGTNDINGGTTAAAVESSITTYCASVHADGGICVYEDIMPRLAFTSTTWAAAQAVNTWAIGQWTSGTGVIDQLADRAGSPIMGTQAYIGGYNATYFADGTHPTPTGNKIIGQLEALAVWSSTHQGQPFTLKVTVPYIVSNAAATSQVINLLQLGPKQKVTALTQRVSTAFAGATVAATVGNSLGTASTYAASLSFASAGFQDNGPPASAPADNGVVQATFTSSAGNLSGLTAGSVDFDITVVQQP